MLKFFILLLMLTLFIRSAISCSCYQLSIKENFEKSAAVFEGEVLKTDTVSYTNQGSDSDRYYGAYLVTLKILKQYKGNFYSDTVLIITGEPFGSGDCGYNFGVARKHLIYASNRKYKLVRNSDPTHSIFIDKNFYFLETTYCDRTTENVMKERNIIIGYLSTL